MTKTTPTPSEVELKRTLEGYLIPIPAEHYAAMEDYELSCPEDLLITRLFALDNGIADVAYYEKTFYLHVDLRQRNTSGRLRHAVIDPRPRFKQIAEALEIKHTIDTFINEALTFADMLEDDE